LEQKNPMQIRKLDTTNKRDIRKFIEFPGQLYKRNPYFCPALEAEVRSALDRERHPFYRHSTADFFLAESEGEVLGRIAAVQNSRHNEYRGVKTAFFWAFDVLEDPSVAHGLFEAAFEWSRQHDCDTILGPRGLTGSDAAGVLVEGFDQRAVMGVPYNYPYYDTFITSLGFEKLTDHLSGYAPASTQLSPRVRQIAGKIAQRRGYRVKSFASKKEMRAWAPRVLAVHEEAFAGTHEWHPEPPEEMQRVVDGLIDIADPRLIKLLLKDDQVIGFAFVYPDLSDAIRRWHGKIHLLSLLDIQREYRHTRWLVANGIGVLPKYQNLGADAVLFAEMESTLRTLGQYEHIDIVQVNEINFASRADMEHLGVKWYKKHRSYTRKL
jgi:GNAT superfamily N-acetyltransferase